MRKFILAEIILFYLSLIGMFSQHYTHHLKLELDLILVHTERGKQRIEHELMESVDNS